MSAETVTDPAPAPLAFVDVSTNSGTVRVICEPINEWLAVTPDFDMDEDGKTSVVTTLAAEWRTEAACGPETADWFWMDDGRWLTVDNKRALRLCQAWSYIAGGRAFMAARRRTKETK